MMNSRRGEPCALNITFYLINRKKAVDPEDHSTKGIHFGFHASKAHSYTYRVIFISLLLYSDLYCKKWLIFYGSSSCYNDNKIKMKEKKRKGKTYFRLARFDPERPSDVPKDVTTRLRKLSRIQRRRFYGERWKTSSLFKQNWRHHHRKHIQSV